MSSNKTLPIEVSYVRSGNFADCTAKEINEQVGLPPERLVFKYAPDTNWHRYLVFKFDTEAINGKVVKLAVKLAPSITVEEDDVWYEAFALDFDGDVASLTYNTLPAVGEPIARARLGGFNGCDISEYIAKAKADGKKTVCFAVTATKFTVAELRLTNPVVRGDDICIRTYEKDAPEGYVKALTGDEKKDAEIWAWAEKVYAEWKSRYDEMVNDPPLEAELIETPEEQYKDKVWFSSSSKTYETSKAEAKTRLFSSLEDIDELAPKKDYKIDKFGGLMDEDMKQEATGFFYVKKIGKRFWVIDPLGYPFVIRSLSQIGPNYQGSAYQMEKTLEKYGSLENWGETISKHMRNDLGFYVSSSPNPYVTNVSEPIIQQRSIGFVYQYGKVIGTANSKGGSSSFSENNTMNVFDPAFVDFADERAQTAVAEKDNPYILGYTTDNELPMQQNMLFSYLTVNPENPVNHYSYACAWTWFKNMSGKEYPTDEDIKDEYFELFRGFVWDRYYNVVSTAMRKYDQNHMLLGTRFLTGVRNAEWVLKFASRYLDCITINWYFTWQPQAESIYLIAKTANCPFMVTEFYTKAADSGLGNTAGAGQFVQTQKERGMFYQNYTLRLLEAKNCVGWHWFQYLDNDPRNAITPDGRVRDISSTDSNKGIMSNEHEEYTECTKYMAEINKNAYRLIEYFDKKYEK